MPPQDFKMATLQAYCYRINPCPLAPSRTGTAGAAKVQNPLPLSNSESKAATRTARELLSSISFTAALGPGLKCLQGDSPPLVLGSDFSGFESALLGALDQTGSFVMQSQIGTRQPHATLNLNLSLPLPLDGGELLLGGETMGVLGRFGHVMLEARRLTDRALIAHGSVDYLLGIMPGGHKKMPQNLRTQLPAKPLLPGQHFSHWLGMQPSGDGGSPTSGYEDLQNDRRRAERPVGSEMLLPFGEHLVGAPQPIALHGGAVAAALVAGAQACVEELCNDLGSEPGRFRLSHIGMIYMRSGLAQNTEISARVMHRGRQLIVVQMDAWQRDRTRHLATAITNFTLQE